MIYTQVLSNIQVTKRIFICKWQIKAEKVDCAGQSTFSFSVIFETMRFYHLYFFVRYMTAMIETIKQTKKITISPVNSSDLIFILA